MPLFPRRIAEDVTELRENLTDSSGKLLKYARLAAICLAVVAGISVLIFAAIIGMRDH
jgi:hypothetical protein